MTRAGEKLYGDWERRIRDGARPPRWRRLLRNAVLLVVSLAIFGAAIFGFG